MSMVINDPTPSLEGQHIIATHLLGKQLLPFLIA